MKWFFHHEDECGRANLIILFTHDEDEKWIVCCCNQIVYYLSCSEMVSNVKIKFGDNNGYQLCCSYAIPGASHTLSHLIIVPRTPCPKTFIFTECLYPLTNLPIPPTSQPLTNTILLFLWVRLYFLFFKKYIFFIADRITEVPLSVLFRCQSVRFHSWCWDI